MYFVLPFTTAKFYTRRHSVFVIFMFLLLQDICTAEHFSFPQDVAAIYPFVIGKINERLESLWVGLNL